MTRWLAICWLGEVDALTGDYGSARRRYEEVLQKGVASDGDLARHTAVPDLGALLLALGEVSAAAGVLQPAVSDFQNEVPLMRIPSWWCAASCCSPRVTKPVPGPEFRDGERSGGADGECPVRQPRSTTISDSWLSGKGSSTRRRISSTAPSPRHAARDWCPASSTRWRIRGDRHPPAERRRGRTPLRCRRHDPCFHRSRSEGG